MCGTYGYANLPVRSLVTGKKGRHLCYIHHGFKTKWDVVVWDGDNKPSLVAAENIEIQLDFHNGSKKWSRVEQR